MALYRYQKAKNRYKNNRHNSKVVLKIQKEPLTLWSLINGIKNDFKQILTTSKFAGIVIPGVFIFFGIKLLYSQFLPVIEEKIQRDLGYFEQGTISLANQDSVKATQQFLSNPGAEYFEQLQNDAFQTNILVQDPISNNYNGTFKLSIPDLGLYNLRVQGNVNSGVEEIYDQVLEKGLAHMEGTGLPISNIKNNMVVYGHSASGDYFKRTGEQSAAFSVLGNAKVGMNVEVLIEGKAYNYKIRKTKIVKPGQTDIITGESGQKQTLTLFTCWPPGNRANRLVTVADLVED